MVEVKCEVLVYDSLEQHLNREVMSDYERQCFVLVTYSLQYEITHRIDINQLRVSTRIVSLRGDVRISRVRSTMLCNYHLLPYYK